MNTTLIAATSAEPAARRMPRTSAAAPAAAFALGATSAFVTLGNPGYGPQSAVVTRVRDAKQAAPPRGELH